MVKSLENSIIDMNTHHHEESYQSTCGDVGAWLVSSAGLHSRNELWITVICQVAFEVSKQCRNEAFIGKQFL